MSIRRRLKGRSGTIQSLQLLGVNLNAFDWTPAPWVDLVENARGLCNPGTYTVNTSLGDDDDSPNAASRLIVSANAGQNDAQIGTYKIQFDSLASISLDSAVGCSLSNVLQADGKTTADLVVTSADPQIIIDFSAAAPGLKIIHPGYSVSAPPVLKTDAAMHYKQFSYLRMMDVQKTNASPVTSSADKTPNGKRLRAWPGGWSWQKLVSFSNAVYSEPESKFRFLWVCVPHKADSAYRREFFAYLAANLDPGINVIAEYSNEVWNSSFQQFNDVLADANAEVLSGTYTDRSGNTVPTNLTIGGGDQYDYFSRLWARRFMDMALEALDEFGEVTPNGRIRPVLMGHFVNTWHNRQLAFFSAAYPSQPIAQWCHTMGGAPYMQGSQAEMDASSTAEEMLSGLDSTYNNSRIALQSYYSELVGKCATYGLAKPMAYECGFHTHFATNLVVKRDAHVHPGAKQLTKDLLNDAWARGWGAMCWWTGSPGGYLSNNENSLWPSSQTFNGDDPKHRGLLELLAAAPPSLIV